MFDHMKRKTAQRIMDSMLSSRAPVTPGSKDGKKPELTVSGDNRAMQLLQAMSIDEKLAYVSGVDSFCVRSVPRLGIPRIWMSDATSGIRGLNCTVTDLPSGVAMAASWNRATIYRAAAMVGEECRATGIGVLLAPGVNIARVPTCGRNFEYMGEDPVLAGEMAAAYIQGAQSEGVITTVKHFACNNSDYDRHKTDSVVDERTLREIYLPAFKRAVEAGTLGLMTSYNQINGEYASEHEYLVERVLRNEWGYEGLVVSDWNSLYSTVGPAKHGVDIEMPDGRWMGPDKLKQALVKGDITLEDIDRKVLHLLTAFERAGLFDRALADAEAGLATAEHRSISDAMCDEAVVLLKNEESILPLKQVKNIVICGYNAHNVPTGGGGSSKIVPTIKVPYLEDELKLKYPQASITTLPLDWDKHKACRSLVQQADVVCIETGYDAVFESESYDRIWELPDHEAKRIKTACALNKQVVVVLHSGGDLDTSSWIDGPKAILQAFYLGTGSSKAIAKVLSGEVNPSGKLPFTMAKRFEDYPSTRNYPQDPGKIAIRRLVVGQGNPKSRNVWQIPYAEGLMVGYRHFDTEDIDVDFPFGHGLSYTTFSYGIPKLESAKADEVTVALEITNTGSCAGFEVVQLYVHEVNPTVFRPEQELKAFDKVFLEAGTSSTVRFTLSMQAFSWYDDQSKAWKQNEGEFELRIGASSRDIRQVQLVTL